MYINKRKNNFKGSRRNNYRGNKRKDSNQIKINIEKILITIPVGELTDIINDTIIDTVLTIASGLDPELKNESPYYTVYEVLEALDMHYTGNEIFNRQTMGGCHE